MGGLREFFQKPAGKVVALVLVLVGLSAAGWSIWSNSRNPAADAANTRWFVDSATMKPFRYNLKMGETVPVVAPSGGKTGYPAELCYWTADGKVKDEPTPVLLNRWINKPEPTFCPDCGRLVRELNPVAEPGRKPPPKKDEYRPGSVDE